jgi:hypothetical protein
LRMYRWANASSSFPGPGTGRLEPTVEPVEPVHPITLRGHHGSTARTPRPSRPASPDRARTGRAPPGATRARRRPRRPFAGPTADTNTHRTRARPPSLFMSPFSLRPAPSMLLLSVGDRLSARFQACVILDTDPASSSTARQATGEFYWTHERAPSLNGKFHFLAGTPLRRRRKRRASR